MRNTIYKPDMTPKRLKAALIYFFGDDFIARTVAELGVNHTSVRRWVTDGSKVPGPVEAWVREKEKANAKRR